MTYKNIPRLLINKELKDNSTIELNKSDKHYLKVVLRLKQGDVVNIFNGKDGEWEFIINNNKQFNLISKKKIRNQKKLNGPTLYFALIKNHNLRWMIEKATELGVKKFYPLITDRTNNKKFNEKKAFLHIKEACEVSGRITVPSLEKTTNLKKILEQTKRNSDTVIFCNENRKDDFLHNYLFKNINKKISFLVGPEGGFSLSEESFIKSYNHVISVKLFDRVIRAETATILALSVFQSLKER